MNLVVCPTPIGNLEDVSPRQRDALDAADIIACEDTRRTGKLLELLGIARTSGRPKFVSYHDHNAGRRADELVAAMQKGERVVLVSDAGTPGISDPGYRLVRASRAAGLSVVSLPGPCAATVALSASGLASDRFFFEGFFPSKTAARRERLRELEASGTTVVAYESPRRLLALLEDVESVLGDVDVFVGRELTKLHEEHLRGKVSEVFEELRSRDEVRGEVTVVIEISEVEASAGTVEEDVDTLIRIMMEEGVAPSKLRGVIARVSGMSKSDVFDRMEHLKPKKE